MKNKNYLKYALIIILIPFIREIIRNSGIKFHTSIIPGWNISFYKSELNITLGAILTIILIIISFKIIKYIYILIKKHYIKN